MSKRIAIFGRSGSGKSALMYEIIAPARRLILFDYLPTGARAAAKLQLARAGTMGELKGLVQRGYARGFRIWYQPPIDNQVIALHALSEFLWNLQERIGDPMKGYPAVTLAVDEMSDGFPNVALPADRRGFYRLSKAGRHVGINLVGASQRPAQVNTEFRGNLDAIYFFSFVLGVDLQAVKEIGGPEVQDFSRAAAPHRWYRLGGDGARSQGRARPI